MEIAILAIILCVAAVGFWILRSGIARSRIETEGLRAALEGVSAKVEAALRAAAEKKPEPAPIFDLTPVMAAQERTEAASVQLNRIAEQLRKTADEAQKSMEASTAQQSGLKAALETLEKGIEVLPGTTDAILRRFEERSAELLEENALKAQEVLLVALERAGRAEPHAG